MSDNLGAANSAGGPEYLDAVSGDPLKNTSARTTASGKRRGLLIGGGIVGAVAVGAGAWAATSFFANGAQPAEALPASTLAYVSIDVSPSGEQMLEAYQFAKKFPLANAEFDLTEDGDPRKQLFEWIQDEGACEGIDFAQDVEPWLGTTAALAAVDLGKDGVTPVAVVQIKDEEAAKVGMKKLQACDKESEEAGGWAFSGDWAVVAEKTGLAEDVIAATDKGTLASSSAHSKWLDEVGDLGVMTMYVAPEAIERGLEMAEAMGEPTLTPMLDQYRELYQEFTGMAATLRFRDEGLEFVAATDSTSAGSKPGTQAGKAVGSLPNDTAAALGLSPGDDFAEKFMEQLANYGGGEDTEAMISEFEQQLGLQLPEDLKTLLGESFVLAVSGDIEVDQVVNSTDGSDVPIGLKITGDAAGIESVVTQLRSAIGPLADTLLVTESSDNSVAVSPSESYRKELLAAGSLGDSETFQNVVGDVASSSAILFVDFDAADNWLDQAVEQSGDEDLLENIEPLSGLGFNTVVDGEIGRFTLRLATE